MDGGGSPVAKHSKRRPLELEKVAWKEHTGMLWRFRSVDFYVAKQDKCLILYRIAQI